MDYSQQNRMFDFNVILLIYITSNPLAKVILTTALYYASNSYACVLKLNKLIFKIEFALFKNTCKCDIKKMYLFF